jgi:hypothetical protein
MKLLLCLDCHDLVKFGPPMQWRACTCGRSSARYLSDGVSAQFYGANARAVGIDNTTIVRAARSLQRVPDRDDLTSFPRLDAWIFPIGHYRIQHVETPPTEPPQRRRLTSLDLLDDPPSLTETAWDDEPFPLPPS